MEGKVSCKWCQEFYPNGQVEYGQTSCCIMVDKRMRSEGTYKYRIDPIRDKDGQNYNGDCPFYKRANPLKLLGLAFGYCTMNCFV